LIPQIEDPRKRAALRQDPKLWVRNALRHPIDPSRPQDFKTEDNTPLRHLLDDQSWLNPDQWADINVLLLARGEMKSTSVGWIEGWFHDAFPQGHSYIVAPSKDQVIDFLEPIRETYVEQADMGSRRKTDNKTTQVFKTYREDENGDTDPILGRIQSDSGYSEESVRGKHSQVGVFDEIQDFSERVFNVALPAIDQGLPDQDWAPTVFCIGTPKETGTLYHDLWERSDKRTWDAEAGEWIIQAEVDPYELSAEEVADLPGDLELDDEGEKFTVHGWHIDWINSPLHTTADIARAKRTSGPMEFHNEVLAQFYDPEDNLLADKHVEAVLSAEYDFRETPYTEDSTTVVVADWGGGTDKNASDTVMLAAEEVTYEDGTSEYVVLDMQFLDPNENLTRDEIRAYEEYIQQFRADVGLVDYGYGTQAMESLQNGWDTVDPDGYMDTVFAAKYGNVSDRTDIKWKEDDDGNQMYFTCDKGRSVTRMVESVRDEEWIIPKAGTDDASTGVSLAHSESDGVKLINQLTAPFKTLREGTKTGQKSVVIETSGNQRDDAFDVMTLAWLALNEVNDTNESVVDFAGSKRAGA
jgi:hypothetical protein